MPNLRDFSIRFRQLYKIFITLSLLALSACGHDQSYSTAENAYSKFVWPSCNQENYSYLPDNINLYVPYTAQNYNYCGPASLSMVMQHYGSSVSQEEIGDGVITSKGITTEDLVKRAEDFGFLVHVSNCSFSGLLSILSQGSPVIARVTNASRTNGHFIVITGYDKQLGLLYMNDPDNHYKNHETFEDFKRAWDIKSLAEENSKNLTLVFYPTQVI